MKVVARVIILLLPILVIMLCNFAVVADRVGDDMVFSTVLDISPIEVGVNDKTVSLCYQVHGEKEKFYNLVSDDCLSVNAHVTQPVPGVKSHVIDKIGIRAIGNNATYCYDIGIARENCSVTVNGNPISVNEKFTEEGIEVFNDRMIARNPNVIRISVPNCGRALVDAIQITCTEYNMRISRTETVPVKVLELTTTRGISPIEAAHGVVGKSITPVSVHLAFNFTLFDLFPLLSIFPNP